MKVIFFYKNGNIDYRISGQILPINSLPLFTLDTETHIAFEISDSEKINDVLFEFKYSIQDLDENFDLSKIIIVTESMLNPSNLMDYIHEQNRKSRRNKLTLSE